VTWITLGIGSNINAVENLTSCLDMLLLHFHDMAMSSVFESDAIGYDGAPYLNMVVGMETEMSMREVVAFIKEIERKHGRQNGQPSLSSTTLDIDILTFGHEKGVVEGVKLPRPEIAKNAFVLWPLSQVAGRHRHPELNQTYADLWKVYDKKSQKLKPVHFEWHGKVISSVN
jgi:2-amino-4-hydroxy-6-hydroxymethyldihydropteridine diphosphokinase